jgi:iron-sulfur cluster assembly protein
MIALPLRLVVAPRDAQVNRARVAALERGAPMPYLEGQEKGASAMFGIPGKQAVTLTPAAARQIAKIMERDGAQGLKIGIKKGGCAGMEYTMDYAQQVDANDEVVEQDGARVLIAPMAQMFLFGTEIDYEASLLEAGFKFRNPNVTEACGCGESIKFDESLTAQG